MTDQEKIAAVEDALDGVPQLEAELEALLDGICNEFGHDAAQKLWDEACEEAIRKCEAEAEGDKP
jgi:hypothetical protein